MASVESGTGTSNAVSLAGGSSPSDHVIQVPPNGDEGITDVQESSQTRSGDGDNNTANDTPPHDQDPNLPVRPVNDDLFENVRRALSTLERFSFDLTVSDLDIRHRSNNHPQGRRDAAAPGSNATPDQQQPPPANEGSVLTLQVAAAANQQPPAQQTPPVVPPAQPANVNKEREAPEQGDAALPIPQNNGPQADGPAAAAASAELAHSGFVWHRGTATHV